MREITKKFNVYKYNELTEEQKEKVLSKLSDINTENIEWYNCTLEDFKNKLQKIGFSNAEIHFSGFWSQGDGACFDAELDIKQLILYLINQNKTKFKKLLSFNVFEFIEGKIIRNPSANHYSHEMTRTTDIYLNTGKNYKRLEKLISEFDKEIESIRLKYCYKIYRTLEKEYDYLTSREAIEETISCNEYEFTEEGEIY
jgi:hypothetical protein